MASSRLPVRSLYLTRQRIAILREMASAPGPVTIAELVEKTGLSFGCVYWSLRRFRDFEWVSATRKPKASWNETPSYNFELTERGRNSISTFTAQASDD